MSERPSRLLSVAAALVLAAIVVVVLGVDATAEMPVSADRFVVLIAAGVGGGALFLTAALLGAVQVHTALVRKRRAARAELHAALRALADTAQPVGEAPDPAEGWEAAS